MRPSSFLAALAALAALPALAFGQPMPTPAADPSLPPDASAAPAAAPNLDLPRIPGAKQYNIVFILVDDLRYDVMGFMNHPFLKTPNIDSLAKNGAHIANAFVTTSLCSPSRATILTGVYAHTHHVVDNQHPIPPGTVFVSQYLQRAGYQTAFIGKWHMGGLNGEGGDAPEPGWDHWVSFREQGSYWPNQYGLNIDGRHVPQKGYITDELTDYAMDWLNKIDLKKPFILYLSHKACHESGGNVHDFIPAPRHKGVYEGKPLPRFFWETPAEYALKPMWVRNQINSWHGIEFAYHSNADIGEAYRHYCETVLAVDDSLGRILQFLREHHQLDNTLIMFMGDNGFLFGDHGLIDKRNAYEPSMRVPLVMQCPALFKGGQVVKQMVANLDIAPTWLEAAGLQEPKNWNGQSILPLAEGKQVPWRKTLLYEYYWERNYPQTPTMHALRTDRYKYIHYYGVWDTDELYDIQADPHETKNLIMEPALQKTVKELNHEMFAELKATHGMYIPLNADSGDPSNLRRRDGSPVAQFPEYMMRTVPKRTPENEYQEVK